ncbi:MAG: hypothetical protein OHK0029_35150 [Armatimonadaceae bacterium]
MALTIEAKSIAQVLVAYGRKGKKMFQSKFSRLTGAFSAMVVTVSAAQAQVYSAKTEDPTNAAQKAVVDNKAAQFITDANSLGTVVVQNFEGYAANSLLPMSPNEIASGVSVSSKTNVPLRVRTGTTPGLGGYAVSGTKYLQWDPTSNSDPSSVTFTFNPGIQGFGAYFTAVGTTGGTLNISFFDSSDVLSYNLTDLLGPAVNNAHQPMYGYFGFLAATRNISSMTFTLAQENKFAGDVFGIDDMAFVRAASVDPVPEPGEYAVGGMFVATVALGLLRGRRRRTA